MDPPPSEPSSPYRPNETIREDTHRWPDDGLLAIASAALLQFSKETHDPEEASSALSLHHELGGERRRFSDVLASDCPLTRAVAHAMQSWRSADSMEMISSDTLRCHLSGVLPYEPLMEIGCSEDEECGDP